MVGLKVTLNWTPATSLVLPYTFLKHGKLPPKLPIFLICAISAFFAKSQGCQEEINYGMQSPEVSVTGEKQVH